MKLVYISNSTLASKEANSIHVMKMSESFSRFSSVKLIARKGDVKRELYSKYGVTKSFDISLVVDHFRSFAFLSMIYYAFLASARAIASKPDYVYSRNFLASAICVLFKLDVVFEAHGPIESSSVKGKILKYVLGKKEFKNVVVISEALKLMYSKNFDVSKFHVAHDAASEVKLTGDSDKKKPVVGYTGHLYQGRGIDIIIGLARRLPQIDFHVVGGNFDDIERWKLHSKELSNITFFGYVDPSIVPSHLSCFDILLAPYQKKVAVSGGGDTSAWMSPLKVFEYMSTGKPIVSSNLPVLQEVLIHKKNAWLCTPDSMDEWEEAIVTLLDDEKLSDNIGTRALHDFEHNYTWNKRAKTLLSLYLD